MGSCSPGRNEGKEGTRGVKAGSQPRESSLGSRDCRGEGMKEGERGQAGEGGGLRPP